MTCLVCGRALGPHDLYMDLSYHLERYDPADNAVTVEQANSLLVTCFDHTPPLTEIVRALRAAGLPALAPDEG